MATSYLIRYTTAADGYPEGAEYEVADLAAIRRVHPKAWIVTRIESDELGNVTRHRFTGKQPDDDVDVAAEEPVAETEEPVTDSDEAPAAPSAGDEEPPAQAPKRGKRGA